MEEFVEKKTIEESAKRYERKIHEAYDEIDKSHIRKMQKSMHLCAVSCCDDTTGSFKDVQNCVDSCVVPLNNAQQYLKNEFQDFQNRVQRCLMSCNDKVRDTMDLEKNKTSVDKYKLDYEQCANSCLTRYSDMLPSVLFKIRTTLDAHTVV